MLSKKGAPLSPPAQITYLIFLGGGWRGGLGGKGGNTFCVPAFLVATRTRGTFSLPTIFLELEELAACIKRDSTTIASRGNRQDTKRNAVAKQSEAMACSDWPDCAFIACLRAWTRPPCEPASKCKQCVNEWSATKWSGMREHSVCYHFWKTALVEPGEMKGAEAVRSTAGASGNKQPLLFSLNRLSFEGWWCKLIINICWMDNWNADCLDDWIETQMYSNEVKFIQLIKCL